MRQDRHQIIVYIAIMGMEGCWLYTLMAVANKHAADGCLSVPLLLLLYPLAFIINRVLQRLQWTKVYLYIISWLVWVVGMLLMVKVQLFGGLGLSDSTWLRAVPQAIAQMLYTFEPALLILLSSALLWWLGQRLAYARVNFTTSVSEFQFGLVILLITLFVASQLEVELTSSVPVALVFTLFALPGISVAHAREGTGWLSGLSRKHWAGLLLASTALILVIGLLIGSIVTPDLLQWVLAALKWIWGAIVEAVTAIASLLPLPESEPAELPPAMPMPDIAGPMEEAGRRLMPESVRRGIRITIGVVFIGGTIFALWQVSSQILGWLRCRSNTGNAETRSLSGAFWEDILGLLERIRYKLSRLFHLPFRLGKKVETMPPEIASVRQIYRQLLCWAAAGGYPRQVSQTPQEYLYTLVDLVPEAQGDLDSVTQLYVSTRYGPSLPTENELHQLAQGWQRIRQNRLRRPGSEHTRQ